MPCHPVWLPFTNFPQNCPTVETEEDTDMEYTIAELVIIRDVLVAYILTNPTRIADILNKVIEDLKEKTQEL